MNWKAFWEQKGSDSNALAQVGRRDHAQKEQLLDEIAAHIASLLELKEEDVLLDMCCGNGLLTSKLQKYCKRVVGVDFSETLVSQARKAYPGIKFICADALKLDEVKFSQPFTKINLYFSFQYFESFEQGKTVVDHLKNILVPGGRILIGDVPDMAKFFHYYNSFSRIAGRVAQMLKGKNDMGKFWSEDEFRLIGKQLGLDVTKLKQPRHLPYAHYRMDVMLHSK